MAIIRWSPFGLSRFGQLFDEDLWPELPTADVRGLNIYETENAVVAEAAMPGIPEDKIDVTVSDNVVRVTGSFEEKAEEKGKKRYFLQTKAASFNYAFRIPEGVKKEPNAELSDGVLTLAFKKVKKAAPKKVKVKVAKKKTA